MLLILLALVGCRHAPPPPPAPPPSQEEGYVAPPDARPWYLKAVAAEVNGDFDEALRSLEWVTRLDRGSPWPWIARGRLAEHTGDLEAARLAYLGALGKAEVAEAHLGLGRILLAQDQVDAARIELGVAAKGGLALQAWRVLVDVEQPAIADAAAWVGEARQACRLPDVRAWFAEREAASWGPEWEALSREARFDAPGCATNDAP